MKKMKKLGNSLQVTTDTLAASDESLEESVEVH